MTAKRDAHLAEIRAADQALVAAHASAARTWPIAVHLTPFAAGCADVAINHRKRWATFYGRTVDEVVMRVLVRLNLTPSDCSAAPEGQGDVALLAPVAPERLGLVSGKAGELVPQAIFWDGLTVDQLRQSLADLQAAGWKPPGRLPLAA